MIGGIDPGTALGWGQTTNGLVTACGLVRVRLDVPMGQAGLPAMFGATVYVEFPIYRQNDPSAKKVDPNDLMKLAGKAHRVREYYLERGNQVVDLFPHDWKGMVPKDIHNARILAGLSKVERALVDSVLADVAEGLRNNVIDGIGLAVFGAVREGLRR